MTLAMERSFVKFPPSLVTRYTDNGYKLIGHHSGVQVCRWAKAALKGRRHCYKRWYGIQSHRCLQITPTLQFCNLQCVFCWRFHEASRSIAEGIWDDPAFILDEGVHAQRKLLSGFKPHPDVTPQAYREAMNPVHVAISLDGEPTLYPKIADFIAEVEKRKMTSFLVTNGTMPSRIREMALGGVEPTNLYISVYAPQLDSYLHVTNATIPDIWRRVKESLSLLRNFQTSRTIIRLTLVKGLNMADPGGYASLIERATSHYVELKGYSWLGESRMRLPISAMPTHQEVVEFADAISEKTGYSLVLDDEVSRVALLSANGEVPLKVP